MEGGREIKEKGRIYKITSTNLTNNNVDGWGLAIERLKLVSFDTSYKIK